MAHNNNKNKNGDNGSKSHVYHDFLGPTPTILNHNVKLKPHLHHSSSSALSDLASERRAAGNHLEGVPFYGPRSDVSGSNKVAGSNKRSISDSTFIGPESLESSQLMKLLRNSSGGERLLRRSMDDDAIYVSQQMRPNSSASLIFQPPPCSGVSKLDRLIPMNGGPPRGGGHFVPFAPHHLLPNRFREANASPCSIISQSAADEGSRTGIKGHGVLSSHNNAASGNGNGSDRKASGSTSLPGSSRQKGVTVNVEPESSAPSGSRNGFGASQQMTIFYGGQAHVFDDVHPNKADIIMALAGSNGGSWSTTFSAKSTSKIAAEAHLPGGESDSRGRLCIPTTSTQQGLGVGDRVSIPAGGHQQVSSATKDMRNSVQAVEPVSKD